MSPAELAAYIGAAAWLPQIGIWASKALTKPKLNLKLNSTITLTYSPLGESVALIVALSAERRDAFVTRIRFNATHERGDASHFQWEVLHENLIGIRGLPESLAFENSQPALALKLSTTLVTQKTIWFLGLDSKVKSQEAVSKVQEHVNFLKSQSQNVSDDLIKSKEFAEAKELLSENLFWREGKYKCELEIQEASRKLPVRKRFEFVISKPGATTLRNNSNMIESYLRSVALNEGNVPIWARWVAPLTEL